MYSFKQFLDEEQKFFGIAPHGFGSYVHADNSEEDHPVTNHPLNKAVGNEPFKDNQYFRRSKLKNYMNTMRKTIASKSSIPPVSGIEHPANPNHVSIIDGNHRYRAHVNARTSSIPVEKIPHENVRLLHPNYEEKADQQSTIKQGTPLTHFRKSDGTYDMNKPEERLGGLTLRHYFTNPDGTHKFNDPNDLSRK